MEPEKISEQEKLLRYLELAEELRSLTSHIVAAASPQLQVAAQTLPLRDRVLIGLALKMYSSFDCLMEDAKRGRSEAMHHLKTMVETFVYFHWVGKAIGETRARLVFAEGIRRKLIFFERNPGYVGKDKYDTWKTGLHDFTQGLEREWKEFKNPNVEKLAREGGQELKQWYERVYRQACEPAHIGDLQEYMPLPREPIRLDQTPTSVLRAHVALDYGLHIILALLKTISGLYRLDLGEDVERLNARLTAIRSGYTRGPLSA